MYYWQNPNYGHSERGISFREKGYFSLYIKPVGTNYLLLEDKRKDFVKAVNRLSDYLSDRITNEVKKYKNGSYRVLLEEDRDEADFALEIELTEVGFGTPVFYVAAWAVPLPGVATTFDATFTAKLAFEGRMLHINSNNVDVEFYDRKIPKIRLFDINKAVSQSGPLRDISNDWAKEIAQTISACADRDKVKGRRGYTLIPW